MELFGEITRFGTGVNGDCGSLSSDDGGSYGFNLSNVDDELYDLLTHGDTTLSSIGRIAFTPGRYINRQGIEKAIAKDMHLLATQTMPEAPQPSIEEPGEDGSSIEREANSGITTLVTESETGRKLLLSVSEQIAHMVSQGIKFENGGESVRHYLEHRNNYFRLRAFRSGFKRSREDGINSYIDLSFETLAGLADIDSVVRETFLHLTLDIEHAAKMELLRIADNEGEDPYAIVEGFLTAEEEKETAAEEAGERYKGIDVQKLERSRRNDPYVGGLIERYSMTGYPLWAFLELITFGNFNYLYMFCANRFQSQEMEDNFFLLQVVKNLRNACAHGNCILNDLGLTSGRQKINRRVESMIRSIDEIDTNDAMQLMNNHKVHQLITTMFAHSNYCSKEQHAARGQELQSLVDCFNNQIERYERGGNTQMLRFIELFRGVVGELYRKDDDTCHPF